MRVMSSGQPTPDSKSTTVISEVRGSNLAALLLFMMERCCGGEVGKVGINERCSLGVATGPVNRKCSAE